MFAEPCFADDGLPSGPQLQRSQRYECLLPREDYLVGQTALAAGYQTAFYGKWGVGGSDGTATTTDPNDPANLRSNPTIIYPESTPNNHGFQQFLAEMYTQRAHNHFVDSLWSSNGSGGITLVPTGNTLVSGQFGTNNYAHYTDDLFADKTTSFIREKAVAGQPFYAEFDPQAPHAEFLGLEQTPGWFDDYANVPGASSWTAQQKGFAAAITRLDKQVGQIIAALEDPNGDGNKTDSVMSNTVVVFTSDNGDQGAAWSDPFDASGPFRGQKQTLYEGGMRVPMIVRWDGVVQPGTTDSSNRIDLADWMPTVAELTGGEAPVGVDGSSFMPLLTGQGVRKDRQFLAYENHGGGAINGTNNSPVWAVVKGDFKLIKLTNTVSGADVFELYNITSDISEATNLVNNAAYASMVASLKALATAEYLDGGFGTAVNYIRYDGPATGSLNLAANWDQNTAPNVLSSATVRANSGTSVVTVDGDIATLGFESSAATGASQTTRVSRGKTLSGRNEIRIGSSGRLQLDMGTLSTTRWLDVRSGGTLSGDGVVNAANVYVSGKVAPGLPAGLAAPSTPTPVSTGVIDAAVFNFSGIQNTPVSATSTLSQHATVAAPVDYGPGTYPRSDTTSTDAGNELNVAGWSQSTTLQSALDGSDYVSFAIAPVNGIEMKLSSASFRVWRNGVNSPKQFAILTNLDGFAANAALAGSASVFTDSGDTAQHTITGTYGGSTWASGSIEVRLYGWETLTTQTNAHVNAASLRASFRSLPNATIDATGALTINGSYQHVAGSTLALDLGGVSNADPLNPQFDHVTVNGRAVLAGTLALTSLAGFNPSSSDRLTILSATAIDGRFTNVTGQSVSATKWLVPVYTSTSVQLALALPGDSNLDGVVNFADLLTVASNYNVAGRTWLTGDYTGDGASNFADLLLLASNYGKAAAGSATLANTLAADWAAAASVPEPTNVICVLTLSAALRRGSRRRRVQPC
ncbi:MAG: sulfatase-like hydrolase/transferase [Tepidisphaeraceae bacterium]